MNYDLTDETALLDENSGTETAEVLDTAVSGRSRTYRCVGFCGAGENQERTGALTEQGGPAGDHEQYRISAG